MTLPCRGCAHGGGPCRAAASPTASKSASTLRTSFSLSAFARTRSVGGCGQSKGVFGGAQIGPDRSSTSARLGPQLFHLQTFALPSGQRSGKRLGEAQIRAEPCPDEIMHPLPSSPALPLPNPNAFCRPSCFQQQGHFNNTRSSEDPGQAGSTRTRAPSAPPRAQRHEARSTGAAGGSSGWAATAGAWLS